MATKLLLKALYSFWTFLPVLLGANPLFVCLYNLVLRSEPLLHCPICMGAGDGTCTKIFFDNISPLLALKHSQRHYFKCVVEVPMYQAALGFNIFYLLLCLGCIHNQLYQYSPIFDPSKSIFPYPISLYFSFFVLAKKNLILWHWCSSTKTINNWVQEPTLPVLLYC